MIDRLKSILASNQNGVKIFEGMDTPMPNFKITATCVRAGKTPKIYVLDDGNKLNSVVDKWQFEPGGILLRCGYDYQIEFVNGQVNILISVCFACNALVFNHMQVYKTSKRQIIDLLEEDFRLL
ncbi:MAG: hypothetical protein Q7U74_10030 [Saprospiraceae bacterium]|nr:hypothetical protein [Saprospiraceae bacterium]